MNKLALYIFVMSILNSLAAIKYPNNIFLFHAIVSALLLIWTRHEIKKAEEAA